MNGFFVELTFILLCATGLAIIFRFLKLPPILAYLLTGIVIGPFGQVQLKNVAELRGFADLGVTLLLFVVGLELKLSRIRFLGKSIVLLGILQGLVTSILAFFLGQLLNFSFLESLYFSAALTFSSTIVVVKLLSDRKDLESLHAKLSIGILLIQDIVATCVLVILSSFSSHSQLSFEGLFPVLVKTVALFGLILLLSKYVFPRCVHFLARSQEILFLFSLSWVLGLAAFVSSPFIGFSMEIGGLLAGLSLANSDEHLHIISKVTGLRDYFLTIFFVVLGMDVSFGRIDNILLPITLSILFVLLVKPFVVLCIMGSMGYRKRTSFFTAITNSQISEFSLLIVFVGRKLGHVTDDMVTLTTVVAIIGFAAFSYLSQVATGVYRYIGKFLDVFEQDGLPPDHIYKDHFAKLKDHVVLIGAHRMGESVLQGLLNEQEIVVVVDFDPDIIDEIKDKKNALYIFGDINDTQVRERAKVFKAKLIISTVSNIEDNLFLIKSLKKIKDGPKIVLIAQDEYEKSLLLKSGADYVIRPHVVGGMHLAKRIKENQLGQIEKI